MKTILDEIVDQKRIEILEKQKINSIEDFKTWVDYCTADVYKELGIETPFSAPQTHRLAFMNDWVTNDNFQQSPQEEDSINYIMAPLLRDDHSKIYSTDFI